jgi:hypothetical protein
LAIVRTSSTEHAVLVPVDLVEMAPAELSTLMAALPDNVEAVSRTEHLSTVMRDTLLAPLTELMEPRIQHLRLAAGGRLRWFAPSSIVPAAVVHASPSLSIPLEELRTVSIPKRVALIAADPAEDLGNAVAALAEFSQALSPSVSMTTAIGRGARWGRALGFSAAGLVERPPSPETLLDLATGADVVILLAHGKVIGAEGPAIELMNDRGEIAPLYARAIAARPRSLAGRHVVLLSCEAGFVHAAPHRLGLLLGELLACKPASVTAASWAVPVESALSVCRFVVHALLQGREPEEGLKDAIDQQLAGGIGDGPTLGRRLTPTDRRAMQTAAARAWVTWRP